jgi:Uma2 family endonuclease
MTYTTRAPPPPYLLSTDQYLRMGEAGVIGPDERVELIRGHVVRMAPIGPPHASEVSILARLFTERVGRRAIVWSQQPIRLSADSMPEPDIMLLHPRYDQYWSAHPTPREVFLLVEVSDSTLDFDRHEKMPLYAANGIVESWIVDLNARAIRVFREPTDDGYRSQSVYRIGQSVALSALDGVEIAVAELFPV